MTSTSTAAAVTRHLSLGRIVRRDTGHPIISKRPATRVAFVAILFAVVAAGSVAGAHYWRHGRFIETTDDAYVQADSTIVAPKVSGYVRDLLVTDNQTVKAGQPLADIDERDLRNALDDAKANVTAAAASVANLEAQLAAQGALIREADAGVAAGAASLSLSQRNDARRYQMAQVGYGSVEQADDASTDAKEKAATLERLRAAAVEARQQVSRRSASWRRPSSPAPPRSNARPSSI